ncbi:hypothetical protein OfM1_19020 [Lactovum odontotermitis]
MTNYKHTTVVDLIRALEPYKETALPLVLVSGNTILNRINIRVSGTDGNYIHIEVINTGKPRYNWMKKLKKGQKND